MAKLVGWKVWYDDGSVFSSLDGDWKDAPAEGVQILVEYYEDGTKILHLERDYYILDEGKAFGTNNIHPWLRKQKVVKYGRWTSNSKFAELIKKAKEDTL